MRKRSLLTKDLPARRSSFRRVGLVLLGTAAAGVGVIAMHRCGADKAPQRSVPNGVAKTPRAAENTGRINEVIPRDRNVAFSPAEKPELERPSAETASEATTHQDCPATQPVDGTGCTVPPEGSHNCGYGEEPESFVCACQSSPGMASVWQCRPESELVATAECPALQPQEGGTCSPATQTCFYGYGLNGLVCICGRESSQRWSCISQQEYRPSM
jgi:hypothetical protein